MEGLFDKKLVFFGGKGGVGKTTCASAFALRSAQSGKQTLLVSTDLAHSLSDLFQKPIGHRITELESNLFGLEINPDREAAAYLDRIQKSFSHRLEPEAARSFSRQLDFAASSPGTQEAALFDRVTDLIIQSESDFDRIVFDTAPTGQTLRLLKLPGMMASWMNSLSSRRKRVSSFLKMFSRVSGETEEQDPILGLLRKRQEKFSRCGEMLTDPGKTGFYLLMIPERLSILETQKSLPVLLENKIPIRGLIVNRVLPAEADGVFLKDRADQEKRHLKEIEDTLGKWPLALLPQRSKDVMNRAELESFSNDLIRNLKTAMAAP